MDPQHPLDITKLSNISSSQEPTSMAEDIPTTAILTSKLQELKEQTGTTLPIHKLSRTGQAVATDLSQLVSHTGTLLEEKNREDLIQQAVTIINEILVIQDSTAGQQLKERLVDTVEWKERDWATDARKLIDLGKNIVLSSDFRGLLIEWLGFLQQIFIQHEEEEGSKTANEEKVHVSFADVVKTAKESPHGELYDKKGTESEILQERTRQDFLVDQLIELLNQAKSNPQYQEGINTIIHIGQALYPQKDVPHLTPEEQQLFDNIIQKSKKVSMLAKQLLENFANCSFDDLTVTWQDLHESLQKNSQVKDFLNDFLAFISKSLCEKETSREELRENASALLHRLSQLNLSYRPRFEHIISLLRYYFDRMRRDPLSLQLAGDLNSLTAHLFYDSQGNPAFKSELLADLQTIIPAILRNLRYIKIPDIALHEPGLDFVASNIVINVGELVPHHLRLTLTSDIPETEGGTVRNLIEFEMKRLHAEAQNIAFSIAKSGMPPLNDSGLADFRIYEDGMEIALLLEPVLSSSSPHHHHPESNQKVVTAGLQVTKCICRLEHFDLNVHGSGHDWMYYLIGPYVRRLVRQKIEEAVVSYFINTDLVTTISGPEVIEKIVSTRADVESQLSQLSQVAL